MGVRRLTYGLCYPIELTRLCRSRCAFCPYPFTAREPLLPVREIARHVAEAQRLGATMLDFTSGDGAWSHPETLSKCRYYQKASALEYLADAARQAYDPPQGGPLPVRLDVGPLSLDDWEVYRECFACARLLMTAVDPLLFAAGGALEHAPTQNLQHRLQSILDAGEAGMPLTTGIMIGIGESREGRDKALRVLGKVARQYGHLQALVIQGFRPHPATPMSAHPPVRAEEMISTVRSARRHLPPSVRIEVNALDWSQRLPELVEAGVSDLGDLNVRVMSKAETNIEMDLSLMLEPLARCGYEIQRRGALISTRGLGLSAAERPALSGAS